MESAKSCGAVALALHFTADGSRAAEASGTPGRQEPTVFRLAARIASRPPAHWFWD